MADKQPCVTPVVPKQSENSKQNTTQLEEPTDFWSLVECAKRLHGQGLLHDAQPKARVDSLLSTFSTVLSTKPPSSAPLAGLAEIFEREDKMKTVEGFLEHNMYQERFERFRKS